MSTLQVQVAVRVFVAMHIPSVTQLAILHTALQSQQEPPSTKTSGAQETDIAERARVFWQPEWSAWLSGHCSVCKIECEPHHMEERHRTHHDQLIQPAMEMYDKCVSPTPWCCTHCWLTEGVVDTRPLTLNIAVKLAGHAAASSKGNRAIPTTNFQGWSNS